MFQYIGTNKSLSMCSPLCPTLCDPMDYSPTRLLCPWNFSRQEYWSGLPFPPQRDLSNPGTETALPTLKAVSWIAGRSLLLSHQGSPLCYLTICIWRASQVALVVKNIPTNAGDMRIQAQSLGQEDPLEEGKATHSSILAWRIPWTGEPGRL